MQQLACVALALALWFSQSSACVRKSALTDGTLEIIFEWSTLHYEGMPPGIFKPQNSVLGPVRRYGDQLFISVPRWRDGVPSTLNTVSLREHRGVLSPPLKPFPSQDANTVGRDCRHLQNVAAMETSPDGRLFVADSGVAAIYTKPSSACPAKLVVYRLEENDEDDSKDKNAEAAFQYSFPEAVVPTKSKGSMLRHMVLDFSVTGRSMGAPTNGEKSPLVYMSDLSSGHLIVFDMAVGVSWQHTATIMRSVSARLVVLGKEVTLRSGIAGMALEAAGQVK